SGMDSGVVRVGFPNCWKFWRRMARPLWRRCRRGPGVGSVLPSGVAWGLFAKLLRVLENCSGLFAELLRVLEKPGAMGSAGAAGCGAGGCNRYGRGVAYEPPLIFLRAAAQQSALCPAGRARTVRC